MPYCRLLVLTLLVGSNSFGQSFHTDKPDGGDRVTLPHSVSPRISRAVDLGAAKPDMLVGGMSLFLKLPAERQAALERLLAEQRDPKSPNYRKWITPEEFADRFGASPADVDRLKAWLIGQGFAEVEVNRSRTSIAFSGRHVNVQRAFGTVLHRFQVNGREHFANVTEASIPGEFAGLVGAVHGLHDFRAKPGTRPADLQSPNSSTNALSPADLNQIYDVQPLLDAGFTGAGMKIAVAGQGPITLSDSATFRTMFGLPANPPELIMAASGVSTDPEDAFEAAVDVEWAGAIARDATILYVRSDDVSVSALYAIDQNLAPILTISYGLCERDASDEAETLRSAVQRANAQGMTVIASSGDAGPAACDWDPGNPHTRAYEGLSVNFPASIPEVTAVGGTQFNEVAYDTWGGSNAPPKFPDIPEVAWNDNSLELAASGGGPSKLFQKPAWQSGLGVPNDSARDLPDIALTASDWHDPYAVVENGASLTGGGTSFSAPTFASMLASILQFEVANGVTGEAGLGNINPSLYALRQPSPAALHDVLQGNNHVTCQSGDPDCDNGQYLGYSAGPGYDLVTGLGSVDAFNLALGIRYASKPRSLPVVSLTIPKNGICLAGTNFTLTASVSSTSGGPTPTGTVYLYTGGNIQVGSGTLVAGAASMQGSSELLHLLFYNNADLSAVYSGDANYTGAVSPATSEVLDSGVYTLASLQVTPRLASAGQLVKIAVETNDACTTLAGPPNLSYSSGGKWVPLGTAILDSSGEEAVFTTASLPAGSYELQASFTTENPASFQWQQTLSAGVAVASPSQPRYTFHQWSSTGGGVGCGYGVYMWEAAFSPSAVTSDSAGNAYFMDLTCQALYKVDGHGKVSFIASGVVGGNLGGTSNIVVDANGIIYFSAGGGVQKWSLASGVEGVSSVAATGLGFDAAGNLLIADSGGAAIFRYGPDGVLDTYAGGGSSTQEGTPANAALINPKHLATDSAGNVFFGDGSRVEKIGADHLLHIVAGQQTVSDLYGSPNGPAINTALNSSNIIALAPDGDLYILAQTWSAWLYRVHNGIAEAVAGNALPQLSPNGADALTTQITSPTGMTVLSSGLIVITETNGLVYLNPDFPLPSNGMRFVPLSPCRVIDTRTGGGGGSLAAQETRNVDFRGSPCNVPASAQAYSTNVTVVPKQTLGYLTVFPTGSYQPFTSTLNSLDGRVKSNADITPAGQSGKVSFFATDATDLVVDINGYFVPAKDKAALAFYPLTPCRVADTRLATGTFGGPSLQGGVARNFPVQAGSCGAPSTAQAYAMNYTAVPRGPLGFLTTWPGGTAQPAVSTLNATTGVVTANAAIVPAGSDGSINVFASNDTDLVMDITGYFATPAAGGQSLYVVQPCRVIDSRTAGGAAWTGSNPVSFTQSPCALPASAQAFVMNATVVPQGGLGYLTLSPDGQSRPLAATLNAVDGAVTSNLAIIPSSNGSVDVFGSNPTQVFLDVLGYFAP